jgi:hypothetical protein
MPTYLFDRVPGGDHHDDVLVALLVNKHLGEMCDQGVVGFPRMKEVCPDLYKVVTWKTPTVFLVDMKDWDKVVKHVNYGLPDDEEIEDIYDLSEWEVVEFDEHPEFANTRSECWTTNLHEKGLSLGFYKKHEDAHRETSRLDYTTIRNLTNRS